MQRSDLLVFAAVSSRVRDQKNISSLPEKQKIWYSDDQCLIGEQQEQVTGNPPTSHTLLLLLLVCPLIKVYPVGISPVLSSTPMLSKQCVTNPKPVVGVKTASSGSLLSASVNIIDHFLCIFNSGHCSTMTSITRCVGVIVIEKPTQYCSSIIRFPVSVKHVKESMQEGLIAVLLQSEIQTRSMNVWTNKQCSDLLAVRYAICNNQNIQGVIND